MKRPVLFFRSPVVYGTKRNERNPRGNETVNSQDTKNRIFIRSECGHFHIQVGGFGNNQL
jgi:hypothetical protein